MPNQDADLRGNPVGQPSIGTCTAVKNPGNGTITINTDAGYGSVIFAVRPATLIDSIDLGITRNNLPSLFYKRSADNTVAVLCSTCGNTELGNVLELYPIDLATMTMHVENRLIVRDFDCGYAEGRQFFAYERPRAFSYRRLVGNDPRHEAINYFYIENLGVGVFADAP